MYRYSAPPSVTSVIARRILGPPVPNRASNFPIARDVSLPGHYRRWVLTNRYTLLCYSGGCLDTAGRHRVPAVIELHANPCGNPNQKNNSTARNNPIEYGVQGRLNYQVIRRTTNIQTDWVTKEDRRNQDVSIFITYRHYRFYILPFRRP